MEIETLKFFLSVAEHLNISEAARELNLSQPTLSRSIAQLEKELGQTLFIRSRPLRITPAGKTAFNQIHKIWHEYQDLHASMKSFSQGLKGTVKVQDIAQLISGQNLLIPIMREMHESFPNVSIETIDFGQRDPLREIKKGKVDIAFFWTINNYLVEDSEQLVSFKEIDSYENELLVCVEKDHPLLVLQTERKLVLKDLKNERIMRPFGVLNDYFYDGFTAVCLEKGFNPHYDIIMCSSSQDFLGQRLKGRIGLYSRSLFEQVLFSPEGQDYPNILVIEDARLQIYLYCAYLRESSNEAALELVSLFE